MGIGSLSPPACSDDWTLPDSSCLRLCNPTNSASWRSTITFTPRRSSLFFSNSSNLLFVSSIMARSLSTFSRALQIVLARISSSSLSTCANLDAAVGDGAGAGDFEDPDLGPEPCAGNDVFLAILLKATLEMKDEGVDSFATRSLAYCKLISSRLTLALA